MGKKGKWQPNSIVGMARKNDYHRDGPSAEDRALERFTELMIDKIPTLQKDWSKPWFTEVAPIKALQ